MPASPVYAEVFKLNNAPAQTVARSGSARAATLHARVVRDGQRKYRLAGQPFTAGDELLSAPAEEFVRQVCRNLLGRIETADEMAAWLPLLNGKEKRQAFLRDIEQSDECRLLNKYAVYDLRNDPLELKPADPRTRPEQWDEYRRQVAVMQEIDACARAGEPLLTNEADEQIILKRLQDLGYVE
jgi:hypothetical protein